MCSVYLVNTKTLWYSKQMYIYVFICILCAIYVYSYYRYPTNISILQTSLAQFKFDMVTQRLPVVIHDNENTLRLIHEAWFNFNISTRYNLSGSNNPMWHKNRYKYILIEAKQDGEILLYPACKKLTKENTPEPEEGVIAIQASKGQVVILPFKWLYLVPEGMNITCIGLHDLITYFMP